MMAKDEIEKKEKLIIKIISKIGEAIGVRKLYGKSNHELRNILDKIRRD